MTHHKENMNKETPTDTKTDNNTEPSLEEIAETVRQGQRQQELEQLRELRQLRAMAKVLKRRGWNLQGRSEEKRPKYAIGELIQLEGEWGPHHARVTRTKPDGRLRAELQGEGWAPERGDVVMVKDFAYELTAVGPVVALKPFRGDRSAPAAGGVISEPVRLVGEEGCEMHMGVSPLRAALKEIALKDMAEDWKRQFEATPLASGEPRGILVDKHLTASQLRRREQKAKRLAGLAERRAKNRANPGTIGGALA
jgi:hypothetical protein